MKITQTRSLIAACGLSLFALPAAFAHDADDKIEKLDTSGDGQVSRAEHSAGARQMFIKLDANSDGVVTLAEFEAKKDAKHNDKSRDDGKKSPDRDNKKSASHWFSMLDQDGDGRITSAESDAVAEAKFAKWDTNRDGQLSEAEIEAGYKHAKKEKRD